MQSILFEFESILYKLMQVPDSWEGDSTVIILIVISRSSHVKNLLRSSIDRISGLSSLDNRVGVGSGDFSH